VTFSVFHTSLSASGQCTEKYVHLFHQLLVALCSSSAEQVHGGQQHKVGTATSNMSQVTVCHHYPNHSIHHRHYHYRLRHVAYCQLPRLSSLSPGNNVTEDINTNWKLLKHYILKFNCTSAHNFLQSYFPGTMLSLDHYQFQG